MGGGGKHAIAVYAMVSTREASSIRICGHFSLLVFTNTALSVFVVPIMTNYFEEIQGKKEKNRTSFDRDVFHLYFQQNKT